MRFCVEFRREIQRGIQLEMARQGFPLVRCEGQGERFVQWRQFTANRE